MEDMDYKAMTFWWNVIQTLLMAAIYIYVWIGNRHKVNRESIESVERRVVKLEETMRHVPSKDQLDTLHKRITESAEAQKRMEGELHQINKVLHTINEYLMKHGAR